MKRLFLVLVAVGFSVDAHAISRYTSTALRCDTVHEKIQQEGAAIMRYASTRPPGLVLYGRFVSSSNQCHIDEALEYVTIPASDTLRCPVYQCRHVDLDDPSGR